MRFNKAKLLQQGPTHGSGQSQGLGGAGGEKLNTTQQCTLTAQKANRILGCIPSSMASRAREGILHLCSGLVRPHLESSVQLWSRQHGKDTDLLEQVQRRPQQ